jgi:hypothetical protein
VLEAVYEPAFLDVSFGFRPGRSAFDFLGFTLHWGQTRGGLWMPAFKTRRARLRRAIMAVTDWCRSHRHLPVSKQHAALVRRVSGHCNYFGVNGNSRSLGKLLFHAKRAWYKWLGRRSQRAYLTWERFEDLLRDFPRLVLRFESSFGQFPESLMTEEPDGGNLLVRI